MEVGIVGMAGSGRTTVFRALMAHRAEAAGSKQGASPIGVIHVADARLDRLAQLFRPQKKMAIELRVHDLCPSLEPSFPTLELEAMKRMEVLLLVVPGFAETSEEAAVTELDRLVGELCLEDLAGVERRIERAKKEKIEDHALRALELARDLLDEGTPISAAEIPAVSSAALRGYGLITDRPTIAVYNVGEDRAGEQPPEKLTRRAAEYGAPLLELCAALEAEMAEVPSGERAAFLAEYGIAEAAGGAVTRAALGRADVISFFTVSEDECRAWAIARGTRARQAAGKIHSDMERGFIRAEVIGYETLEPLPGGLALAREKGLLRLEGKDYVVQDGDIVHIRFNV